MKVARGLGIKLVCGDSALVIDYWSKGRISREKRGSDPRLTKLVEEAARLRKAFESEGGTLRHVPGRINPADLGYPPRVIPAGPFRLIRRLADPGEDRALEVKI